MRTALAAVVGAFLVVALVTTTVTATEIDYEFRLALSSHFEVPEAVVADVISTGLSKNEIPVALFYAQKTGLSPNDVASMRLRGDSWMGIAKARGVKQQDFYVIAVGTIESKTYAPIFAKFKATPIQDWRKLELTDNDIVNLVNLRFLSSHHDYSIFKTMSLCDAERDIPTINHQVKLRKAEWVRVEDAKRRKSMMAVQSNPR